MPNTWSAMPSQEKVLSTPILPLRPIHLPHSKFVNSVPRPQAIESGFGCTFSPLTSCQTISSGPPLTVETTGLPELQASSNTIPNGSFRLGTQTTSQALYSLTSDPFA